MTCSKCKGACTIERQRPDKYGGVVNEVEVCHADVLLELANRSGLEELEK